MPEIVQAILTYSNKGGFNMLRILRVAVLGLVLMSPLAYASGIECEAGTAIRSPITGDLVDCLPGGGTGCLICGEEIVVTP
jgi:hypothetical protein